MAEPIDLTKFVKLFDLKMNTSWTPITDEQNTTFIHEYKPSEVSINLTFQTNENTMQELFDAVNRKTMKMEQRGRFWFDKAYDVEVVMTALTLEPDGSYSATYESMNINDKTKYSLLARFLRWILRR